MFLKINVFELNRYLERSGSCLGSSWNGLGGSWGGGLGDLGAVWGENIDCSVVLQRFGGPATAAPLPTSKRAGPVEGVRGRRKSLPQELGLEDLDLGLRAWCSVQVIYTP